MGQPGQIPLSRSFRKPERPFSIGVVGLGGISSVHLNAYRENDWPVVVGADIDPARRQWAQREHGLSEVVDDWRRVVEDPRVEVVSLLTHPNFRQDVVSACAQLGKPILVEKPLASSLSEAKLLADTAASIPTTVSQNYRWLPGPFLAHQLICQGKIGEPFFVTLEIFGSQDRDLAGHPFYSTCADFLTVQWNTHLADLIRHFTGRDPVRVSTRTRRGPGQNFVSDNVLQSWWELDGGATGHILHSELARSGNTWDRFRIDGPLGTIEGGIWASWLTLDTEDTGRLKIDTGNLPSTFGGPMGDLLASVEAGDPPSLSFKNNLPTLAAVYAEQASAERDGEWVRPSVLA